MGASHSPAEEYYDRLAHYYEKATAPSGAWNPPHVVADAVRPWLSTDTRILDIGVGTGQTLSSLANQIALANVVGIDISTAMLAICRDKFPALTLFHGTLAEYRQQSPQPFDVAISSGTLEFVEHLPNLIHEVALSLRPRGRFIFTFEPLLPTHAIQKEKRSLVVKNPKSALYVDNFYTYRWTTSEVEKILSSHGFLIESFHQFDAYEKEGEKIHYSLCSSLLS